MNWFSKRINPVVDDANRDDFDGIVGSYGERGGSRTAKVAVTLDDEPALRLKPTVKLTAPRGCIEQLKHFLVSSKMARRTGTAFVLTGIVISSILEVGYSSGTLAVMRYNVILFLAITVSITFDAIPTHLIRPQLCLSLLTMLSFAWDVLFLLEEQSQSAAYGALVFAVSIIMFCKLCVLIVFLRNIKNSGRVRKYLDRRIRLFGIPCQMPRRIMRDVRGRMLAIAWLQLAAMVVYFICFWVFLLYFDYGVSNLNVTSQSYMTVFLLLKTITSMIVLLGLLYDTNIRLCLWYFGCLGFCLNYIRDYIYETKKQLGGWPLAFSFYRLRFQIVFSLKFIDICCGIYGMILIGLNINNHFRAMDISIQYFLIVLMFSLFIFDVWCLILFFGIRWLTKRHRVMMEIQVLPDSDDSEIEDFRLDKVTEHMQKKNALRAKKEEHRAGDDSDSDNIDEELGLLKKERKRKSQQTRRAEKAEVKQKDVKRKKNNRILPTNEIFPQNNTNEVHFNHHVDGKIVGEDGTIVDIFDNDTNDNIYQNEVENNDYSEILLYTATNPVLESGQNDDDNVDYIAHNHNTNDNESDNDLDKIILANIQSAKQNHEEMKKKTYSGKVMVNNFFS